MTKEPKPIQPGKPHPRGPYRALGAITQIAMAMGQDAERLKILVEEVRTEIERLGESENKEG